MMSSLKNKRFSTRLSSKKEQKHQQKGPTPMESHQLVHLELNDNGQHVLPFSRRVINMNLPWLIKEREQQSSTMINHGKGRNIKVDVNPQKEEEEEDEETNNKFLHIVDRRIGNKYIDGISECPLDIFGDPDMSDPRAWCRLYDNDYYHDQYDDDDDDDDSVGEGQRMVDDFVENCTKSCWARYGKSMPDDFINPFDIYDE